MKILFLTPHLGEVFGQEQVVRASSQLLRGAGNKVFFLTDDLSGKPPECERYEVIPGLSDFHSLSPRSQKASSFAKARKFISDVKPDLIHFIDQYDGPFVAELTRNFPTVLSAHSVVHTCPASHRLVRQSRVCEEKSGWACLSHDLNYRCLSFRDPLRKAHAVHNYLRRTRALRSVGAVIAVSRYISHALIKDGWDENKVNVVYNPVIPLRASPLPGTPKPLICVASRLVPLKGIGHLLRALSEMTQIPWKLWICGEGPERSSLEDLTARLDLRSRVSFKGRVATLDLHRIFAASRIVVQPSVGPEAFGLSAAEASSLGVPVVAFDLPAVNEVIHHGENGLLAKPESLASLREALTLLLTDEVLARRLGNEGPSRIARMFSPEMHLYKTLRVYSQVTGRVLTESPPSIRAR